MRLTVKFALTLMLGMCVVLVISSILRVRREIDLFRTDIARDQRTFGEDLAAALATIWTLAGEEATVDFVKTANETKGHMLVQWTASRELAGADAEHGTAQGIGDDRLYTSIPVSAGGELVGRLELSEPLDEERRYISRTVRRTLVTTGAILLVTGAAMLLIGVVYVGRPVRRLVEQARRVAGGDFSCRLSLRQNDELAMLAEEMNRMAEQLEAAHQKLTAEISQRLAVLEQLRHADRLTTVGQLTSGIAHELGTPLNVILAHAKMIATGEVTGDETVESAQVVMDQSERMATSIRQLLHYARRPRSRTESIDVNDVVRDTTGLLRPVAAGRDIRIDCTLPDQPLKAVLDGEQIQQVLTNVLLNAMQAMPSGGCIDVVVARSAEGAGGASHVRVDVRDTGEGIRQEHLQRVFDPFFTTKGTDNTGLGLSIASEIVRDHGGSIRIESEVGCGTSVSILLPEDRA